MSRLKDVMLQFAVPGLAESADVSATPFGLGPLGGLTGLSNLGFGSANFMDLQQKMMREVCMSVLHLPPISNLFIMPLLPILCSKAITFSGCPTSHLSVRCQSACFMCHDISVFCSETCYKYSCK